jgi:hypothetical protein
LRERASWLALGRLVLYDISSLLSLPAFALFPFYVIVYDGTKDGN